MSPSADHLYSNLWVWSTCGVITWIQMGLGTGSPGLWIGKDRGKPPGVQGPTRTRTPEGYIPLGGYPGVSQE